MRSSSRASVPSLPAVVLALVAGCGGGGGEPIAPIVPTSIAATGSTSMSATAGSAVATPPSVVVKDASGSAVAGATVTFVVSGGGGTVTGATQATNASGVATVGSWTTGPTAGVNTLTATTGSLAAVTFTAIGTAGAAASVTRSAGDAQTAIAGASVAVPPAVTVKDANGNPVSGISVTFAVASGGGAVSGAAQTTNASGIATVGGWTLGTTAGANSLTATAGSLAPVSFSATGTVGPVATVSRTAGDGQTARRGTLLPVRPSVTVRDAGGNVLSGVTVTFTVPSGGGSVTGATQTTDASGAATVGGWTLGSATGVQTLTATANGVSTTFSATAVDPCTVADTHTLGTTSNGRLESSDCAYSAGQFVDFYTTIASAAGAYVFQQNATGLDTYLSLQATDETPIASNDNAGATTNSAIRVLMPSGSYLLAASSRTAGATGDYLLSSAITTPSVTNCDLVFVVRGISTTQNVSTSDCIDSAGPFYGDAYTIYLKAGESLALTMSSSSVDAYLQLFDAADSLVAFNDDMSATTLDARIVYTATSAGYYRLFASTANASEVGSYSLHVQ